MAGRLLTADEVRAIYGDEAKGWTDEQCDDLARRAYAVVRVAFETVKANRQAASAAK